MRKSLIAGALALAAVASSTVGANAASSTPRAAAPSKVYVIHGLPLDNAGTKVDVYAGAASGAVGDAGILANDFTFKSVAGPVSLAPASYKVYVAKPTASNDGKLSADEVIFSKVLDVPSGLNLSAIASFDEKGDPTINVFKNDVSKVPVGGGRISIRHAAAAPPVKVDLGYYPFNRRFDFFTNTYGPAANGQQGDVVTAAGPYDVGVRLASSGALVTAIPRFPVSARMLTTVYAVGKPGSSFGFIVARIGL